MISDVVFWWKVDSNFRHFAATLFVIYHLMLIPCLSFDFTQENRIKNFCFNYFNYKTEHCVHETRISMQFTVFCDVLICKKNCVN